MEFKGVFALFPEEKSAGLGPHSRSELSADFTPSTLSAHQMPPEQLVDVPVPSRRQLFEVLSRSQSLQEEEVAEDEVEEEVVGSRFLPHFRPRRWCWYVRAGGICPRGWQCTFAHHESELHPDSWEVLGGGGWLVSGSRGLASLGPFMGAPAGPGAGKIYWGHGVRGLASPDPLLGAIPWCASTTDHGRGGGDSACAYCRGTDRGMPVPTIMLGVEVASLCGVLPQVQFLDKAVDMPVASMTGALGGRNAVRLWMPMAMRGCAWTRCLARTGGTWTPRLCSWTP